MSFLLDVVFPGNEVLSMLMQNISILYIVFILKIRFQLNISCKYRNVCKNKNLVESTHLTKFQHNILSPFANLSSPFICLWIPQKCCVRNFSLFSQKPFSRQNLYVEWKQHFDFDLFFTTHPSNLLKELVCGGQFHFQLNFF